MLSITFIMTSIVMSGFSNLAPPLNLTLRSPTEAAQLMLITSGRPVLSLLMARLSVRDIPFTFRSKEPLSLLLKQRKRHCRNGWTHEMDSTLVYKREILFTLFGGI